MPIRTIREYDTISCEGSSSVSKTCFEWLEKTIYKEGKNSPLKWVGHNKFKVKNYVGILQSPCGTVIEILPKASDKQQDAQTQAKLRKKLIEMICISYRIPLEAGSADLQTIKNYPLHEWLLSSFLQQLKKMVLRGLRFTYERVEEESQYIRGRLDINKQLRQPAGRQHRFQIIHDVFSANRPENRLLKKALEIAFKHVKQPENWQLANELQHMMEEIPASIQPNQDYAAWSDTKLMKSYEAIKPLCWLIVQKLNPTAQHGAHNGMSLLFPMEKLFEDYVGYCLELCLPQTYTLKKQAASLSLCKHGTKDLFKLKPDFIATTSNKSIILDAKWKLLNSAFCSEDDEEKFDKYGLNQSDFYQMFAYGHKYLPSYGQMFLIYPANENFLKDEKLADFDFTSQQNDETKKLKLQVMACDWQANPQDAFPSWFKSLLDSIQP
ncbi:MAG: McrC family protein [Moraxellaceae bacterium]|nr:McrC family protein [Moraxellaceae bacterium]